jgi:hypothetical protein
MSGAVRADLDLRAARSIALGSSMIWLKMDVKICAELAIYYVKVRIVLV